MSTTAMGHVKYDSIPSTASELVSAQNNPFSSNWRARRMSTVHLEHVSGGTIAERLGGYMAHDRYGSPISYKVKTLGEAVELVERNANQNPAGWTYSDSAT